MTGFTSRWVSEHVRETTDGLLRLDIRQLVRQGVLSAGRGSILSSKVAWTGSPHAWIIVRHDGDEPDAVTLEYRTRTLGGDWEEVCERFELARTACGFGGTRSWVRCLGCGGRRAILYSFEGLFRCRTCHDLAYASTRESAADRAWHRA